MKCYINTVKGSENHIMTEFTESTQGLPLLLFTILERLSEGTDRQPPPVGGRRGFAARGDVTA